MTRIYLPPDANTLLSVADHCLRSSNYVNVIVADKQLHLQYLDRAAAIEHCRKGIGIWNWAGTERELGAEPDLVMACAGDVPTLESLAATAILREYFPELQISIAIVSRWMRSIACHNCKFLVPMNASKLNRCSLIVLIMPANMGSTNQRS